MPNEDVLKLEGYYMKEAIYILLTAHKSTRSRSQRITYIVRMAQEEASNSSITPRPRADILLPCASSAQATRLDGDIDNT